MVDLFLVPRGSRSSLSKAKLAGHATRYCGNIYHRHDHLVCDGQRIGRLPGSPSNRRNESVNRLRLPSAQRRKHFAGRRRIVKHAVRPCDGIFPDAPQHGSTVADVLRQQQCDAFCGRHGVRCRALIDETASGSPQRAVYPNPWRECWEDASAESTCIPATRFPQNVWRRWDRPERKSSEPRAGLPLWRLAAQIRPSRTGGPQFQRHPLDDRLFTAGQGLGQMGSISCNRSRAALSESILPRSTPRTQRTMKQDPPKAIGQ